MQNNQSLSAIPKSASAPAARPLALRVFLVVVALTMCAGFIALGAWQIERRAWKLDLINHVNERIQAPAVTAPGPDLWPQVNAANDEYRRVVVSGKLLRDSETLVKASTELGSGFWVMTPLRTSDGSVVLINRGFVTSAWRHVKGPTSAAPATADKGTNATNDSNAEVTSVTGLLRITQTGGGFLRHNDAVNNLWYSPDVQAIGAARGLHNVAPYFIDANATATNADRNPDAAPVGGLTIIAFQNNHLVYAITWFLLALLAAGAAWRVGRGQTPA